MGEKITHADRVLDHIKTFGKITSLEAFAQYGITRLSAAIWVLRHEKGLEIADAYVERVNRYGDVVRFKAYYLKSKKEQKND